MNRLRVIILISLLTVLFSVRGAVRAQGDAKPINYGDSITAQVKGGTTLVYSFDGAEGDSVTVSIKMKGQGIVTFHDSSFGVIDNVVPKDINGIVASVLTVKLTETGTHYLSVQVTTLTADFTFTLTSSNPNANNPFGFPGLPGVSFTSAVPLDFAPDTAIKVTLQGNKIYLLNVPGDAQTIYNVTIKRVDGSASLGMSILDAIAKPIFEVTMGSMDTMTVQVKFTETGAYAVGLYQSNFVQVMGAGSVGTDAPTVFEVTFSKVASAS